MVNIHRLNDLATHAIVKENFIECSTLNSNRITMHVERGIRYVMIILFFISVTVGAAQIVLRSRPQSSDSFCSMLLVYSSMIIPVLLLLTRGTPFFLRHTQKCRYLMYSFMRDACVMSILMNSQLHSSVQTIGLERLKPVVTIAFLTLTFGYEMLQHQSFDTICIATMTTIIAALICSICFVLNDTRWISLSRWLWNQSVTIFSVFHVSSWPVASDRCLDHIERYKEFQTELVHLNKMIIKGKETMEARSSLVRHVSHEVLHLITDSINW